MRLCHGTSFKCFKAIMAGGLRPRGRRKGNWENFPSHPDMVYLTDAFAPYFANMASSGKQFIIEVDVDLLDERDLHPDEDLVAQSLAHHERWPLKRAQRYALAHIEHYQSAWKDAMEHMGTVAHMGAISPDAFTRYVVLDVKANPRLMMLMDPSGVSPIIYRAMGENYRGVQRWLFEGGELPMVAWYRQLVAGGMAVQSQLDNWERASADRTGVEVVELHPPTRESKSS